MSSGKKGLLASIPDDVLLSNIFIRLRAKQVAQMRSLSKTWNAYLSNPSFIKSHLDCSMNTNDEILMVFIDEFFSFSTEPFTAHPSRSPCLDLTSLIKLPVNTPPGGDNIIIGSVNGLICFDNRKIGLHIWNPSLSALMLVPPYNTDIVIGYPDFDYNFRFGFDPKTSDYKVVKIAYSLNPDFGLFEQLLPVEMYSMRKDSWKLITKTFPSHLSFIHNYNDEVYVDGYDGYVHWLCYIDDNKYLQTIIAFDLNLETFTEILLPDCTQSRANVLGVLSKKLCVISPVDYNGDCEVWVMDGSWMKLHKFSGRIIPIGFTLKNEFLFAHDDDLSLALYDPNAVASKLFKMLIPGKYLATKVAQYIDSLVWVAPGRHQL